MAQGRPIYIIDPIWEYHNGMGFVPYYYADELKEKGIE